jgi:polyisoprenoid-binding protein YceI
MKRLALAILAAAFASAAGSAAAADQPPPGAYSIDMTHASLNFRLSHMGLSRYTARFTRMKATLTFDPARPQAQAVTATIDATSLQTNYPNPKALDFDSQVERQFLDTAKYPTITFRSTKVEPTGAKTAKVTGDLTLHGVTKPVTLEVTYNGGYPAGGFDPSGARVGFSAHGQIRRSDFGITFGLPAPGSEIGVGDEIDVAIEAEFTQPGPKAAAKSK